MQLQLHSVHPHISAAAARKHPLTHAHTHTPDTRTHTQTHTHTHLPDRRLLLLQDGVQRRRLGALGAGDAVAALAQVERDVGRLDAAGDGGGEAGGREARHVGGDAAGQVLAALLCKGGGEFGAG